MTQVATVTIQAAQVSADLTDFPLLVNLADMPAGFWSTVANGGGDIRVFKADGTTELPREVVSCDTATDTGELHLKFSGVLSSSSNTDIQIHADGVSVDYAAADPMGRNAVWTDYKAVYHFTNDKVDSTGLSQDIDTDEGLIAGGYYELAAGAKFQDLVGPVGGNTLLNVTLQWANTPTADWQPLVQYRNAGAGLKFEYRGIAGSASASIYDGAWNTNNGFPVPYNEDAYLGFTLNSSYNTQYTNLSGTEVSVIGNAAYTDEVKTLTLGGTTGTATKFKNVRVRSAPSDTPTVVSDWLTAEYNNQSSPGTFYTVTAAPLTITSITPTTGPSTGGTTVTIYGSGFLSGTPEPRFNGVLATDVAVVNDGEITCVTPAL